ncbi:protein translocase subunit SecF [Marisediminicola sp. LYQ85]|uniref:protein translocase subunit SecF n=1 Tax=Marisediminicola sp. LYQ85 TaxID=3391062 RepID=UPI00398398B1
MANLTEFGNDLYTGKRSIPFIAKRKLWYTIAIAVMAISIAIPLIGGGFNLGIEFRGGSQFQVTNVSDPDTAPATEAVAEVVPEQVPRVTTVGDTGIRVQTEQLSDDETREVAAALAESYGLTADDVASSFVGPSWGADITGQAIRGLLVFLGLAAVAMALYFRTWKMSVAAMVALLHDLVFTAGVYALAGFEVTPAAVIGFLTILGFSLYDTVVVFDKIRENTAELAADSRATFSDTVNLAVNQTLVRSINTGVVAALPVAAILFIGSFVLGADTLRDISLALLVGIIAGTYSTIFVAAPLYSDMRRNELGIKTRDERALAAREVAAE